ncbi:MAG: AMIN-like domain-containing (lipo)protein [Candidatus Limnocylindria bacterium]
MSRTQLSRPTAGALVLIAGILLAGCTAGGSGSTSAGPSASTVASASAAPSSSPISAPSATASASATEPTESLPPFACTPSVTVAATTDRAQITDVRVATHQGYDRVVFDFASGIPDAVIEGVLPPFYADPSDLEIKVSGTAFLKLTMHGASGVAPDGTVTYGGATNFQPGFAQLVQLIEGGDFEAVSTWYLGLNGGGCTRVVTLSDPSRLVLDIEH